jgi:ABC-type multidrug transport system ATPase subunit
MALILKNNKFQLSIDTRTIIGVMGDYEKFIRIITGDDIYFIDKIESLSNNLVSSLISNKDLLKEFDFEKYLNYKIKELSHSNQKLLQYLLMIQSNKKIIVIDEPFMDLDYGHKKKIILLINKLIKNKKTVIIGSVNSNIIYSTCKKVLFIKDKDYYYGDIDALQNKRTLKKYDVDMPDIVNFVSLAKEKKIKIRYSYDIRDLIKDVYRNVSKK